MINNTGKVCKGRGYVEVRKRREGNQKDGEEATSA
jgi:hypothetical protein